MFDSLTDLNILEKADELFADGYNATADFLFGESTNPNGDGGITGSRVINKGLGYRIKRQAMEALGFPPDGFVGIWANLAPALEYPLGLTKPSKGSSSNGPYMTFYAFEYKNDVKGSSLRRSASTVSTAAVSPMLTGQAATAEGVNELFSVSLPFRGNVKKNITAEVGEVESLLNKAVSVSNDGNQEIGAAEIITIGGAAVGTTIKNKVLGSEFVQESLAQASLSLGYAINPSMEMLYKKPAMNVHSFEFTFVPVSSQEAEIVNRILNAFQEYSLPTETGQILKSENANGILTTFPALYEIRFFGADTTPMKDIADIPDCYLTNIDVIYDPTGTGRLTTDNRPISYRLSLTFTETKMMTRNDWRIIRGLNGTASPGDEPGRLPDYNEAAGYGIKIVPAGYVGRIGNELANSATNYAKDKIGELFS